MADLFSLDAQTLATVQNGIDSLIHQLGKMCKLVSDTERQLCNNCNFDSVTQRSSNIYNGVGPKPFRGGKCPVCHGSGFLPGTQGTTDIVQLLVDWQPKPYQLLEAAGSLERLPAGLVHTKGFVTDMPKIIQAKYMIIDYANATYQSNRFTKYGEPTPSGNIVKARYFICLWQRMGD